MFRFELPADKVISYSFVHGRYLDAWSIQHFLSGSLLGMLVIYFGAPKAVSLSVVIGMLFLYEMFEAALDIVEDVENALCDVLVGAIGASVVLWLAEAVSEKDLVLLGLALTVWGYFGWRGYLKKRLKKKPTALLPSRQTYEGRKKIRKDTIIFLTAMLIITPLPMLLDKVGWLS